VSKPGGDSAQARRTLAPTPTLPNPRTLPNPLLALALALSLTQTRYDGIEDQVQALYAHLRHQTKAYGTIEGLETLTLTLTPTPTLAPTLTLTLTLTRYYRGSRPGRPAHAVCDQG
jgi:hypothetical protein